MSKDRPFVTLAKELNYVMSQPGKHVGTEIHRQVENAGRTEEQLFTVTVHDPEGKVVLFRQVSGHSAVGVINQMETEFTRGNLDYGRDTTDYSQQPDFVK